MVGNMLGNTIMNAFGGSGEAQEQPQEQYAEQAAPASGYLGENEPVYGDQSSGRSSNNNDICPIERTTVVNCLNNSTDCQWAIDLLNKCKQEQTGEKLAYH